MTRQISGNRPLTDLALCLLILVVVNLACTGFKKPWRDYSPKPFSSQEWLTGDKIERGRMLGDMFRNPKLDISNREAAIRSLGEPDLKRTIDGKEVWFYRMDLGIVGAMDLIPISFDENGRGSTGYAHGDTMSIAEKEEDLP